MIPVIVILLIIPVIGLILFLLKTILKAVLFCGKDFGGAVCIVAALWVYYGRHSGNAQKYWETEHHNARGWFRIVFGRFYQGRIGC